MLPQGILQHSPETNFTRMAHEISVSQMRTLPVACREPVGKQNRLLKVSYVFGHKTEYILIHAKYTRIVVLWHISNIPPKDFVESICYNSPMFYTAAIFVKYCYTTAVGCCDLWANMRCLGCSLLGEKELWNRTINQPLEIALEITTSPQGAIS